MAKSVRLPVINEMKECGKCGSVLPISEFWKSNDHPGGVRTWCKECSKKWRLENKKKVHWNKEWWWFKQLIKHGIRRCTTCKRYKPDREPYYGTVKNAGRHLSRSDCKQCRIAKMRKHLIENVKVGVAKQINDYKSRLCCSRCGMSFKNKEYLCDFHHIDPNTKEKPLFHLRFNFNRWLNEVKKCIPVCANCHRIIHNDMRRNTHRAKGPNQSTTNKQGAPTYVQGIHAQL